MLKPCLRFLPYFLVVRWAKTRSPINFPESSGVKGYKAVVAFRGELIAWKTETKE